LCKVQPNNKGFAGSIVPWRNICRKLLHTNSLEASGGK
jgi:hypothetical protein